jgi:hypothetical protein
MRSHPHGSPASREEETRRFRARGHYGHDNWLAPLYFTGARERGKGKEKSARGGAYGYGYGYGYGPLKSRWACSIRNNDFACEVIGWSCHGEKKHAAILPSWKGRRAPARMTSHAKSFQLRENTCFTARVRGSSHHTTPVSFCDSGCSLAAQEVGAKPVPEKRSELARGRRRCGRRSRARDLRRGSTDRRRLQRHCRARAQRRGG